MGQLRAECRACTLFFNSTRSFDRHRTGTYRPNTRRCLTIDEMMAKGFTKNAKGWWGVGLRNSQEEGGFEEEVSLPDDDDEGGPTRVPNQLDLTLEKGDGPTLGDEATLSQEEEENKEATQVTVG